MTMAVGTVSASFTFPKSYYFPPFFSPQPTLQTRQAQLRKWSILVQTYCRHHRIHELSIIDALDTPLFYNAVLKRRLSLKDAKEVIDHMASSEGDERADWVSPDKASAWVWWRKPEEWANLIAAWVEESGQKGTILTLYELVQGESTEQQEFHGLDSRVLLKSMNTLVKKGKAQVFGTEDQQGVKFF